ncbi:nuclear receptor-interacting protein 2 isoform X1 [Alligator mississippiensis]|uniref:Nuclear receptor-interacting protein 2 n=1 Tax=Alligator mississippiensis TaxID=8496 RepID=A0A151P6H8_ALLMI|nr:nuclear receptor-interacting protein 2 isoform X1 [Alligator mississippiensis]KYO44681.1 nuclear receptor-interacting protein 2 [Alligator mississippiensis]
MSTRKASTPQAGPEDGEEKPSEGTPDLEGRQREAELRDKAILQQKRRLKQATQFVHKDSADLLPLDGLKRLGTSKDLQPHSVIQRRLLEGNLNRLRGENREHATWAQSPLATDKAEKKGEDRRKEPTILLVHCKCEGQVLRAAVNTGCQQNLISRSCLRQLGLEEVSNIGCRDFSLPVPCVVSRVEHMEVQFGQEMVACSALVVDDEMLEFSLGLQTLLSLKCCIDLDEGVLRLKALSQELPFLPASEEPGQ